MSPELTRDDGRPAKEWLFDLEDDGGYVAELDDESLIGGLARIVAEGFKIVSLKIVYDVDSNRVLVEVAR